MTQHDEPAPGAAAEVTRRTAARVLLIEPAGRLLLLRGRDPVRPEAGSWWFTPGGGIKPNESPAEAAVRELREEVGLDPVAAGVDLGPIVAQRSDLFTFSHLTYWQTSLFFVARTAPFEPSATGQTAVERDFILGWHWWNLDDLQESGETVYPADVAGIVRDSGLWGGPEARS